MSILLHLNSKINKKLVFVLKSIYGIGYLRSKLICINLGYNYDIRMNELKQKDLNKLNSLITLKYKFIVQSELKKSIYDNIKFMKNIKCYRGMRHIYQLPVNGQRTRNNAKTQKWWR